jgi:protease-4
MLRQVADDPDVSGVILLVKGLELERTHAQNLAALIARFRGWDALHRPQGVQPKEIIVWLEEAGAAEYLATCAADKIYFAPLATWELIGLRVEAEYYRETLARLGLHADVVRVAPWKTAADALSEAQMSPEAREQYAWMLDSLYADMTQTIAAGRRLDSAAVRTLIDGAPLSADEAVSAGLADGVCYEDELESVLSDDSGKPLLKSWADSRRLLKHRARPSATRTIGVLDLSGAIMSGYSRRLPVPLPLFGGALMGSSSVQQAVRAARKNDHLSAIVAYVDSPGGSALASDLIERELRLLAKEKPLVVYMGPVAASGGYYIAAPARTIIAQRGTLTGSIGVVTAKLVTQEAYAMLQIGRESVQRGENAALYSDTRSWNERERERIEAGVDLVYTTFKQRVSSGRHLSMEQVEQVAGGRVWTGEQASERGLVDALGDFESAVEAAASLAGLPPGMELRLDFLPHDHGGLLAEPVQAATELARLAGLIFARGPHSALHTALGDLIRRERVWLIAESLPRIRYR